VRGFVEDEFGRWWRFPGLPISIEVWKDECLGWDGQIKIETAHYSGRIPLPAKCCSKSLTTTLEQANLFFLEIVRAFYAGEHLGRMARGEET
jgi:hypothetical protein